MDTKIKIEGVHSCDSSVDEQNAELCRTVAELSGLPAEHLAIEQKSAAYTSLVYKGIFDLAR